MELVTPAIGLAFWTLLAFTILLLILRAFAWKPILGAVKTREESIENSLKAAEKAKEEMQALQASNEELLKEAYEQRDALLKTAKETHDQMISEAKGKAQTEADKLISQARTVINNEKNAALTELKQQVASLSIDIAEKIIKEKLSDDQKQHALVANLVADVNLN